jgi:hypothetical protein
MNVRTRVRIVGVVLLVVGSLLVGPWLVEPFEIERCLSSGGSYNYVERQCEAVTSHIPSLRPGLNFQEMLGLVLVALGVGTVVRSFKRHAL